MTSALDRLPPRARELLRPQEQPEWTAPMLAVLTNERFSDPGWIYERKLDGERCLAFRHGGRLRLLSRTRQRAAQRRRGVLLPLRHPPSRGQRHLRAPAPRPEVAAAQRAVLRGPTSLPASPQHRGRGAVPGRLPQGLGGPDRQARRRAVPARPLGGLAEAQVRS